MDVGFGVFWWLNLHNKVNQWDIKPSGGNISGDENLELSVLESLHGDLTLILGNTTVHYLDIVVDGLGSHELVGIIFCLSKHDDLSSSAVDSDYFGKCLDSVVPVTFHFDVLHILGSFV